MEKELGKEYLSHAERIQFLKDNCDSVEYLGYVRKFTPEEITEIKSELSDTSIKINDIEEEKKAQSEIFKSRLKPLYKEKQESLKKIKNKSEYVEENCFKFINHASSTVGYYNEQGDLVEQRPIKPDERQTNIFNINKKISNG